MAVTAWASPASAVKIAGGWSSDSANNLLLQDGNVVTWGGGGNPEARVNNFGFSDLPDGATIDGIEAGFYGRENNSIAVYARNLFLQKVAGTNVGTDQGPSGVDWNPWFIQATNQWHTFGGPTNLWGTTWNTSELKAAGFGLYVKFVNLSAKFSPALYADAFRARVYYTAAASGAGNPNTVGITRRRRR